MHAMRYKLPEAPSVQLDQYLKVVQVLLAVIPSCNPHASKVSSVLRTLEFPFPSSKQYCDRLVQHSTLRKWDCYRVQIVFKGRQSFVGRYPIVQP